MDEKNVFDPGESADVKPVDMEGKLYLLKINSRISRPVQFKQLLFKGQLQKHVTLGHNFQ